MSVDETRRDRTSDEAALVAGLAHEINNPITYVLANLLELERLCEGAHGALAGYRQELRSLSGPSAAAVRSADLESKLEEAGGLEAAVELLADATEGARRIQGLVRELLALARPDGRVRVPLRVEEVLDQTLRLVARPLAGRAELSRDYAASCRVAGDPARLGQVFLNLLTNALDACASSAARSRRIHVRTRDCALGVRIEIEDGGPGVAPEVAGRIFAPFVTTKPAGEGTGLGLYLSQRIVREHGGTLEFEPSREGGAVFRVELPAAR